MVFLPLGNSDLVVVSVSVDFRSNSQQYAPFHDLAHDYSHADWDDLGDHLRDVPWEDFFKLGGSAAASDFVSGFNLEFMYISLIKFVRSSLTHLHGFYLLVLLP